ncbi:MAG: hypothetical protein WA208_12325 [Thermoanaerobaculia bacterium]
MTERTNSSRDEGASGLNRFWTRFSIDRLQTAFNFILMVTAVGGLCYLDRQTTAVELQLRVMQDQLSDARIGSAAADRVTQRQLRIAESQAASTRLLADTNKQTVAAAQLSAAAAAKSLDRTEQHFRVAQRARVAFDGIGGHGKPAAVIGDAASFEYVFFKNYGLSDALYVRAYACAITGRELPRKVRCSYAAGPAETMGPGGSSWVSVKLGPFSEERFAAFASGELHVWIVFGLEYRDEFGGEHVLSGCNVADPELTTWKTCPDKVEVAGSREASTAEPRSELQ